MNASACIEQIQKLGFKAGTQLNIFCPGCSGSIKVFSDKPDEAEIYKFLVNHTGHDCFFEKTFGGRLGILRFGVIPKILGHSKCGIWIADSGIFNLLSARPLRSVEGGRRAIDIPGNHGKERQK